MKPAFFNVLFNKFLYGGKWRRYFQESSRLKPLLLHKIKIKQNKASQIRNIMQSLNTFIRILGLFSEVKKPALINDRENIAYWE